MILLKNIILKLLVLVFSFNSFGQESYLIRKDNIAADKKDKKKLEKKTNENKSNNKLKKEDAEFVKSNSVLVKDNQFHIIYKPFQDSLSEEAIIKVIETSNKFNKEEIITIKSYASRNKSQGSSEARRLSLSRALEVRSIFIENNFPATNILIKALGTEKNKEGFTDIILIEVN